MRTTAEKYKRLCDMKLIDGSKYDINQRVEMIIQELQNQLKEYEEQARKLVYGGVEI